MNKKQLNYNTLGKTGLCVTEVAFGAYRIDIKSPLNREALKKALLSGINLIDTSSTYTDGNSELLIGDVLKELVDSNRLSRESLVIVTKAGYLQGQNYELSQTRKQKNKPFPDLVEYRRGLEHCIHPEFLEDQITRSLERLGIETIDVYLLHNPEYYLKWAEENNLKLTDAREEYYSRIKKAFEYLEKEVKKGRIKYYGISSNTFPLNADIYDFTCLERVVKIAEEISSDNHFSVIEFPMNLAETGAYTNINQPDNMTLLEFADRKNLGVLINRPLNAIYDNQLINLAEPIVYNPPDPQQINDELEIIHKLEKSIAEKLKLHPDREFLEKLEKTLYVFDELNKNWLTSEKISNWQAILNQYFLPRLRYCNKLIKSTSFKDEGLEMNLYSCTYKSGRLFNLITAYYNNEYLKFAAKIKDNLIKSVPEFSSAKNLSNMAIRALRATKGITCVLVGMIHTPYVQDVLDELKIPVNEDFDWNKINFADILNKTQ